MKGGSGSKAKAALRATTGADAVDMESHIAARYAEQHSLPFAALRVISDPAHRARQRYVARLVDGATDDRGRGARHPLRQRRHVARHPLPQSPVPARLARSRWLWCSLHDRERYNEGD